MTMRWLSFVVLVPLLFVAVGCGVDPDAAKELSSKSEYSVLQSLEFDYRHQKQLQGYVIRKNALSSGYDVIGLPKKSDTNGYVWLIANPDSEPSIKQLPGDADFLVSKDALTAIESSVRLAPTVKTYLATHLDR